MPDDTLIVSIKIRKDDLPKFISKFEISEYHFKNNSVTIDMTNLFKQAVAEISGGQDDVV